MTTLPRLFTSVHPPGWASAELSDRLAADPGWPRRHRAGTADDTW